MTGWFVILNLNMRLTPLVAESGFIEIFTSEEEARDAAEQNLVGCALGYKVYPW